MKESLPYYLLLVQGAYYAVFAIWPLLHMRSFMAISGPKVDQWLVRTVSVLLLCSAAALFLGMREISPSPPVLAIAIGNAVVLAGIDIYYSLIGRIWKTYLL